MKVTPMLMTSPNVRKILDGRKTQTRRVVVGLEEGEFPQEAGGLHCPYGTTGDILALKETFYAWGYWHDENLGKPGKPKWRWVDETSHGDPIITESERIFTLPKIDRDKLGYHKRPSLYLPKTEWRVFLCIDEVRVERLQDISEADAEAEGIIREGDGWQSCEVITQGPHKGKPHPHSVIPNKSPITSYKELWDSINGQQQPGKPDISWAANPWVWAITFTPIPRLTLTPDGEWNI